jgi:LysM domain
MPLIALRRLGCLAVLAVLMALSAAVVLAGIGMLAPLEASAQDGELLPRLLVAVATCVAGLAGAALSVGGMAVVAAGSSTGRSVSRLSTALTPGWWRRLVVTCCGLGVVAVPAVPAAAEAVVGAPPLPAVGRGCPPVCAASLDGLPLPDLPIAHQARPVVVPVVVRPGDTLWAIAEQHLRPGAPDAHVLELVGQIYRVNRARIGPDPDLIFPGTHLTVPGGNS